MSADTSDGSKTNQGKAHKVESYRQLPEELRNNVGDLGAPVFELVAGLVGLGGLGKILVTTIPNQRMDRLAVFAAELKRLLDIQADRVFAIEFAIAGGTAPQTLQLLKDGVSRAADAVTRERAVHVARIVAVGLSTDELQAQRARAFLGALSDLTDVESAVLIYFAGDPIRDSGNHVKGRAVSDLLKADPKLAALFGSDTSFWVISISKLIAKGMLRTTWGDDGQLSVEERDAMEFNPGVYDLTSVGAELALLLLSS